MVINQQDFGMDHKDTALGLIADYGFNPEAVIEEAFKVDEHITDQEGIIQMGLHFWPVIREFVEKSPEEIKVLYEDRLRKQRHKHAQIAISRGMATACDRLDDADIPGAQGAILGGYNQADKLLRGVEFKGAVRTFKERWGDFTERLKLWRNRNVIGFSSDMKMLTECLLGLRGLVLLGAPTNLGKTILALQLAIDALRNHPETCCIFLSLEMHVDDLMTRACCRAVSEDWKAFVLQGTDEKIERAETSMSAIWERLIIVDRDDFDEDEGTVLRLIEELKLKTGCERILLVVDYLQVWEPPVTVEQAFRTDVEADRWRIEAMKRMKNTLRRDDALLVISEMRKRDQSNKERYRVEDLMGSARLGHAADTVLLWHSLTASEKVKYFDTTGGGILTYYPTTRRSIEKVKPAEIAEEAEKIDDYFKTINTQVYWLEIAKGRDGTIRRVLPITVHYNQLTIDEGFLGHGLDGNIYKKEETTDAGIKDPFDTPGSMDEGEMQDMADSGEGEGNIV